MNTSEEAGSDFLIKITKSFPPSLIWHFLEVIVVVIIIVFFKFRILRTPRGSLYLIPSDKLQIKENANNPS